jgi:ABC-2 type transport system ATP-binding protein
MPWRLSVMENLRIYGYLYGLSKEQFERRAEKFLTRFGVYEQRNKTMNNLSAGQVTRVMLAKALFPTLGLRYLMSQRHRLIRYSHQIRTFVKEQQKEFNTTMIYTSHNMDEVTDLCDRVIFLKQGKIVAQDTPEHLAEGMER